MHRPKGFLDWMAASAIVLAAIYFACFWLLPFVVGVIKQALALILVAILILAVIAFLARDTLKSLGLWPKGDNFTKRKKGVIKPIPEPLAPEKPKKKDPFDGI